MGRTVLPEVNNVVTGNDYVSLVHFGVFGLDRDGLAINRATYSVAEDQNPLVNGGVGGVFSNKDTVFSASNNFLESVHVFDMSLVNACVPEDNTHVVALRLTESKHQSLREVAPHVVRLNVGK